MKKKITILSSVYNEEEVLRMFYERICEIAMPLSEKYDWEFLFINDGSTDSTGSIIRELRQTDERVCYVELSRNFGKEIAMLAGMDYASGDAVVTIDADLQEPPETIPLMIEKWEEGYEDVYGKREQYASSAWREITSSVYHKVFSAFTNDGGISRDSGDFRLLDRKCVDALRSLKERERYTKGLYWLIGFRKCPVSYKMAPRVAGESKWNPRKLTRLATNGIISFSVMPLRLASFLGVITSLVAFCYLIYVLVKAIVWGDPVAGYPTLLSVLLFLGGFVLLCLGIIGEYLGRVFMETKQRPPYFVSEAQGCRNSNNQSEEPR